MKTNIGDNIRIKGITTNQNFLLNKGLAFKNLNV